MRRVVVAAWPGLSLATAVGRRGLEACALKRGTARGPALLLLECEAAVPEPIPMLPTKEAAPGAKLNIVQSWLLAYIYACWSLSLSRS